MSSIFSGKILYANGVAAPDVEVRVFDQDDPGKGDDDLTLTPGKSNSSGSFTVTFEPTRYPDFNYINITGPSHPPFGSVPVSQQEKVVDISDRLIPYLQFTYTYQGQTRQHTELIARFHNEFRLPEKSPVPFLPSKHGYNFINSFPGYPLPFDLPGLPEKNVSSIYGLCGGMSTSVNDAYRANCPVPHTPIDPQTNRPAVPGKGSGLYNFIYERQMDTFGPLGAVLLKYIEWMALPDDQIFGKRKRTYDEFNQIRPGLDRGETFVLGLIYTDFRTGIEVWNNHQVLAHAYTPAENGGIDLHLYDPNLPGEDDVTIHAEKVVAGTIPALFGPASPVPGFQCTQRRGSSKYRDVLGFFAMPYRFTQPPPSFHA